LKQQETTKETFQHSFITTHPSSLTYSITSNNMKQTPNQPNQREAIVDKLHGALSILRKERDELHRAKELASERLRLAKEERVNAEKNLSSLTAKFNHIESIEGKHNRKSDIERLQIEVDRLGREVSRLFNAQDDSATSKRQETNHDSIRRSASISHSSSIFFLSMIGEIPTR
jgi:hypothetical protein